MRKRVKKTSLYVFIILMLLLPSSVYAGEGESDILPVSVMIDGKVIEFDDFYGVPFIDENNRTQVPFRLTLETFGAKVSWDQETRTAYASKEDIVVEVPIGEKYILKNGMKIDNDTISVVLNGRTYLPIRVVMEAFGCEVIWDEPNNTVNIRTNKEAISYPKKYDLRDEGRVTSVKDQGELGTCWAFAALGAFESTLALDGLYDFSEDNISLMHGYNLSQNDGGDYNIALSYFTRWSGPVYEEEDTYGDNIASNNLEASKHLQEAYVIPYKDYATIKRSIIEYGGVHTSIYLDYIVKLENDSYYNSVTNSLHYTGDQPANHDIVIVGWDDDYPKENFIQVPEENGAFICKNSFGNEFGDAGFFYVSYYDTRIGEYNMVYSIIEDKDNYDKIYQSDWLGWVGRLGYGEETAYFSNIYETEDEDEILEAVSFYTTDIQSNYEIYVIEKFEDTDDFSHRKLVTSGSRPFKGYYTIKFDEPILLSKNTKFAVIIKITTPGSEFPVAAEYYKDVPWLDDVDLSDGEGYISRDGELWEDTEELLQSNVCLKAFTSKNDNE